MNFHIKFINWIKVDIYKGIDAWWCTKKRKKKLSAFCVPRQKISLLCRFFCPFRKRLTNLKKCCLKRIGQWIKTNELEILNFILTYDAKSYSKQQHKNWREFSANKKPIASLEVKLQIDDYRSDDRKNFHQLSICHNIKQATYILKYQKKKKHVEIKLEIYFTHPIHRE